MIFATISDDPDESVLVCLCVGFYEKEEERVGILEQVCEEGSESRF